MSIDVIQQDNRITVQEITSSLTVNNTVNSVNVSEQAANTIELTESTNQIEVYDKGLGLVTSVNGYQGAVVLDTDDVPEGDVNLYYTNQRVDDYLNSGDLESILFNTNPAGLSHVEGQIHWDDDDKTLNLDTEVSGTSIQVGQEQVLRATNKTGVTIANGSVVYINGAQGNRPTIALADASTQATSEGVIGVVTADINNNATGYVTTFGLVREVDTSAFSEGDVLYLSETAGAITNVAPISPAHAVKVGECVRSNVNEGVILVNVALGEHLGDLHDVLLSSLSDNDLLQYNNSSQVWENVAESSIKTNPAGSDTQIQYNDNGSFGADQFFTQDTTNGVSNGYGFNINRVAFPDLTGMTATAVTGTELGVGTYYYHVTYYTDIGESGSSTFLAGTTTSGNQRILLENIPTSPDSRVVGRYIYRGKLGDSAAYGVIVGTLADNTTTTFTDTYSDSNITGHILARRVFDRPNLTNNYITIDGTNAMLIDNSFTTFGFNAGRDIQGAAAASVLIGGRAGEKITTGTGNSYVGNTCGAGTTTGRQNAGVGDNALASCSTGSYNVAMGPNVLAGIGGGNFNIAFGYYAGRGQGSGNYNIYVGAYNNISQNSSGNYNLLIGHSVNTINVNPSREMNIANLLYGFGASGTGDRGLFQRASSSQTSNLYEWQDNSGNELSSVKKDGSIKPAHIADASASNDSLYYSTTQNKLVYKDSSGTVNNLY